MLYKIKNKIPTPSIVLDHNQFIKNIAKMASFSKKNNIGLRPHSKSHKTPYISKIQIKNGAKGICVATLFEAEVMIQNNIHNILLTTPVTNNFDKNRIKKILKNSKNFTIVLDNFAGIRFLSEICDKSKLKCNVLIDCDVISDNKNKIGRTGARNIEDIIKLSKTIKSSYNLNYQGICAYAGDLQHINSYSSRLRKAKTKYIYLKQIIHSLTVNGLSPRIVSGGGTGSHTLDVKSGLFTELQPGSYIFSDVEYDNVQIFSSGSNPYKPSLFVACTVISKVNKNNFIVNAGLKAFSTDSHYFPKPTGKLLEKSKYRFMGDEHGLITLPIGKKNYLKIGDTILIQPSHCDPTINLYDKIRCFNKEKIKIWNIAARGYG